MFIFDAPGNNILFTSCTKVQGVITLAIFSKKIRGTDVPTSYLAFQIQCHLNT